MFERFEQAQAYVTQQSVKMIDLKFCDLWGVDAMPLVTALREQGIPVLKLEREYRLGAEGQLRTRVQAFIESMGK